MRRLAESRRLASVQRPVIPVIGQWMSETPGTISLGQGVVSYPPPPEVGEAIRRFGTAASDHQYGPIEGVSALLEALEKKLLEENNIAVRPTSRVLVSAGGNLAFMTAALAILDEGDEVILPVPFYFNHEMAIEMAGAIAVPVPTRTDHQLDVEAIAAAVTPRTRAVVTVSPCNPTGAVYSESSLRAVNALCRDRGLFHVHDEAYEYFTYGQARHFSPGSIDRAGGHTLSIFSMSKAFGMASWRIGYLVHPESLEEAIGKVQDTVLICAPVISQYAALAAVTVGRRYVTERLAALDATRQAMFSTLSDRTVPCDVTLPEGAFFFFLRVHTSMHPMVLSERLIREHRVGVVPGSAFGEDRGCTIRVSYGALDAALLRTGLDRLVNGLRVLAGSG